VIFQWISQYAGQFKVKRMCQLLRVSRSGYYAHQHRLPSSRHVRHQSLARQVRQAHQRSRQTYGSPRIAVELKAAGVGVFENTVARLMREEGLKARLKRRFVPRTTDSQHEHPIAPMESFFSTFKTELVYQESFQNPEQARTKVFEWIEVFYNRQRRHSSLNYLSPEAFEAQIK